MIKKSLNLCKALFRRVINCCEGIRSRSTNAREIGPDPVLVQLAVDKGTSKEERVIPISGTSFRIGRDSACELTPDDSFLSNEHCRIVAEGGQLFIEDLNSTNGTFVNFRRINGRKRLFDGDVIEVGSTCYSLVMQPSRMSSWEMSTVEHDPTFAHILF